MSAKPKKGRQAATKFSGQPAPRWREFLVAASKRLSVRRRPAKIFEEFPLMVARNIVDHGDGASFLAAVRRGRPTQRQNIRYQLLREVERLMGDQVPRRRPDANTPDALAVAAEEKFQLSS